MNIEDPSNGYDALATEFMAGRSQSQVGVATVRDWCRTLPADGAVLDLGCGCGIPISQTLLERGLIVYAIDASVCLTTAFAARFPHAMVACEAVEDSLFFGRQFDGVIAWGLLFLLPAETQLALIHKIAAALVPGGRFLFTAPWQTAEWRDNLTGRVSQSPGADVYKATLSAAGFTLAGEYCDEGDNHYYDAVKP